jgi:hypothetical protein
MAVHSSLSFIATALDLRLLLLEWIFLDVLVHVSIACWVEGRQLAEAFLVNEADFMTIGIGENDDANGRLAWCVQHNKRGQNCLLVLLDQVVDFRLIFVGNGEGDASESFSAVDWVLDLRELNAEASTVVGQESCGVVLTDD